MSHRLTSPRTSLLPTSLREKIRFRIAMGNSYIDSLFMVDSSSLPSKATKKPRLKVEAFSWYTRTDALPSQSMRRIVFGHETDMRTGLGGTNSLCEQTNKNDPVRLSRFYWYTRTDSNRRPSVPKTDALSS